MMRLLIKAKARFPAIMLFMNQHFCSKLVLFLTTNKYFRRENILERILEVSKISTTV